MAYSNHNKYVSYPDWFGSQKQQVDTKTGTSTTIVYRGGGASGTGGESGTTGITGITVTGSGNAVTSGILDGTTIVLNKDLTFLTKEQIPSSQNLWELRYTEDGRTYLYADYDIVTLGGHTMYADNGDIDLPGLYDGLPIDSNTIYWEILPDGTRVLKAMSDGGTADSVAWENVTGKPSWIVNKQISYSEIEGAPDLSNFVTTDNSYQEIEGVKNFLNGLQIANIPITKLQDDVLYIDSNVVIRGGLTMYYDNGEIDLPSIKDEIGFAGYDGATGLASFNSSQFSISSNGTVTIIGGSTGLDTTQLKEYLDSNKYTTETWVKAQSYASASSLSSLQTKVNNFLEGSDTDTIINKWKELEAFLSGLSESDNLATILGGKANKATTLAGYGITDAYTKTQVNNTFALYIPIAGYTNVTGEKNFTGGLRVNNSPSIYYDATNKYWKLEGDLLVTGGVTMYADGTTSGGSSAYSTLGSLLNVDDSIDASASVDRVLFQAAGSSTWVTKPLSEIGCSGGTVSGDYLPLSGGTLTSSTTQTPLIINSTGTGGVSLLLNINNSAVSQVGYMNNGSYISCYDGRIGIRMDGLPIYKESWGGAEHALLHSGNYSSYALPLTRAIYHTNTDNPDPNTKYDNWMGMSNKNTPDGANYYHILSSTWNNMYWSSQLAIPTAQSSNMYYRRGASETAYNSWVKLLDENNYSSYALPLSGGTLTGPLRLTLNNTSTSYALIYMGALGFIDNYSPVGMRGIRIAAQYENGTEKGSIGIDYNGTPYYIKDAAISLAQPIVYLSNEASTIVSPDDPWAFGVAGKDGWTSILAAHEDGYGLLVGSHVSDNSKYLITGRYGVSASIPNGYHAFSVSNNGDVDANGKIHSQYATYKALSNPGINTGVARIGTFDRYNGGMVIQFGAGAKDWRKEFSIIDEYWSIALLSLNSSGNLFVNGGITMYSDIRKKQKLQDVELSLSQIANAPLIEHYYLSDQDKTTHVGSIAQYWAGLNDWFCKLDNEGYYTMEIQNAALASAISIARHLEKYESKTDKKIRMLKKRVQELEDKLEKLEGGNYGSR